MIFKSKIQKLSDIELLSGYFEKRKQRYFKVLFDRYFTMVYGIGLKYLYDEHKAKDIVQQVFEKLILYKDYQKINNFSNWLYSVAKNQCLMQLRSETAKRLREEHYGNEQLNLTTLNEETSEEEDVSLNPEILKQLSDEQARCIYLFYYKDKSYKEVANITGYELKKVKSYIQNGKVKLKKVLSYS